MIFYRDNIQAYDLTIDDQTTIKRRLMVENSLYLTINSREPINFQIGDYTDINGERYILMDEADYTRRNGVYQYSSVLFRGPLHRLEVYMMPDQGRDEWFYYGSVNDHINKVLEYLLLKETGWSVQLPDLDKIANKAPKNINYANMSILAALWAICNQETGWAMEFDVVGKCIKFDKEIKTATALSFEYGRNKGLFEMTKRKISDQKICTRIYGYGGTANMLNGERLSFASVNAGLPYIDKNRDLYGLRETRVNFDHIYPRRKGTITSDAVQIATGFSNWQVKDSSMDFDLNAQIVEGAVIIFNTGECAGVEFDIVDYDHKTKTITFKEYADEKGGLNGETYVLPNTDRKPKKGDEYVFVNIIMPDNYTIAAQIELKQATQEEADKMAVPQHSYSIKCDHRYFKALGYMPQPGDVARVIDAKNGVDYYNRIIEINYPVIAPTRVDLVLADKIPIPSSVTMVKSIKEVKTKLAMLDKNQITEDRLRLIFHPLGGREDLDFATKAITASSAKITSADIGTIKTKRLQSPTYYPGFSGEGFSIYQDEENNWRGEFDFLTVRKAMEVYKLTIQEIQYRAGVVMEGPAVMLIDRVEMVNSSFKVIASGTPFAYKCYFDNKSGLIKNMFRSGDQARCHAVDDNGNTRYYWRLVVAQSVNGSELIGEDYVYLSHAGADVGSAIPVAGDVIGCCGSRSDNGRDSYILRYTIGDNTPREEFWADVHNFNPTEAANLQSLRSPTQNVFKADSFAFSSRRGMAPPLMAPSAWIPGTTAYKNEQYTYDGSTWLCLTDNVTTAPSASNTNWLLMVAKGAEPDTFQLYIAPSAGAAVYRPGQPYNATLSATLIKNSEWDLTSEIHPSMWIWERISELDPGGDPAWNLTHRNIGHVLTLTEADLQGDLSIILTVKDNSNTFLATKTINF